MPPMRPRPVAIHSLTDMLLQSALRDVEKNMLEGFGGARTDADPSGNNTKALNVIIVYITVQC